jgi:putative flippase GtrA
VKKGLFDEGLRFMRYGVVGATSTALLYVVFLALVEASIDPVVAAGACYPPGVALSYLGNRRFTFASQQTHRSDLPRFLIAYGAGFISTLGVLATALIWMAPALAQLVNIAVTPIVIYSTMRLVGFGRPPSTAEPTCHGLDD